ncbi:MAG: hypothetical protein ABI775_11405 [Pseudonocardiales bacterium]
MSEDTGFDPCAVYDRQLLLFGPRRSTVLDLREVQRYGADCYGNADHVSVYGRRPADWYGRGIRLFGRTAVECTGDGLAEAIALDVATVAGCAPSSSGALVIDPFVGSANTLYWIQRRLAGSTGLGFEADAALCRLTKQNLAALESPLEVVNIDYAAGLANVTVPGDRLVIVFIAPPLGDALDPSSGLDLHRTTPPVGQILDVLILHFPDHPLLVAIQVFERVDPASLAELTPRCDWRASRVYNLNRTGHNHGGRFGMRMDPTRSTVRPRPGSPLIRCVPLRLARSKSGGRCSAAAGIVGACGRRRSGTTMPRAGMTPLVSACSPPRFWGRRSSAWPNLRETAGRSSLRSGPVG